MTPEELKERLTAFAADVVKYCRQLRRQADARNIADQLSDAATAIAANYRVACRARSRREFVSKLAVAVEEADEVVGWLEVVIRSESDFPERARDLLAEARQVLAILGASHRTARAGLTAGRRR